MDEMLHLALAGNIMVSLGGKHTLYERKFVPTYPSKILMTDIDMMLGPADKRNLTCFMDVRYSR